jgi:hypothetical protein
VQNIITVPEPRSDPYNFAERGIAVLEYGLTADDVAAMESFFPDLAPRTAGARTDAFSPEARSWFACHAGLTEFATRLLQAPAARLPVQLTRLQAFDKSPAANWFVPWHQDRAEDGHDRPVATLERMVALRIHLDDCTEDNGPLEVVPGSHTRGRLTANAIAALMADASPLVCLADRGDIVAMRPLIVHRSQRAKKPAARRVIHLEYTAQVERCGSN